MNIPLKAQDLYDLLSTTKIEPDSKYYKLLIDRRLDILYDVQVTNQGVIASKLGINPPKMSIMVNILKAMDI